MPSLPLCYITLEDFRASHFLEWSVQKKEFIHHAHNIDIQVLSRLSLSVIIWLFPQPEKPHAQCKKILKNDLWKSHYPKLEKTIALKKVHLWYKILSLLLCNHQKLLNCQEVFSTWSEQEKFLKLLALSFGAAASVEVHQEKQTSNRKDLKGVDIFHMFLDLEMI